MSSVRPDVVVFEECARTAAVERGIPGSDQRARTLLARRAKHKYMCFSLLGGIDRRRRGKRGLRWLHVSDDPFLQNEESISPRKTGVIKTPNVNWIVGGHAA